MIKIIKLAIISKILIKLNPIKFLVSLYVKKNLKRRPDLIFLYSEADKNIIVDKKKVSRFLEPIITDLSKQGYSFQKLLWSKNLRKNVGFCIEKDEISIRSIYRSYIISYLFLRFICTPKIIIAIDTKSRFLRAARILNIKIIESLHGFGVGGNHDRLSPHMKITSCPDAFLVYDDYSMQTLMKNNYKNFELHRSRHPSLEAFTDKTMIETDRNKIITFTMSWGYDGEYSSFNGIINNGIIHEEVIETIKARRDIFWIIRIHPVQLMSNKCSSIFTFLEKEFSDLEHVTFTKYNDCDIIKLLFQSNIHMTMFSSATVEAALVNCPTIALCPSVSKKGGDSVQTRYRELIDYGLVTHVPLQKSCITVEINRVLNGFGPYDDDRSSSIMNKERADPASYFIKKYLDQKNTTN